MSLSGAVLQVQLFAVNSIGQGTDVSGLLVRLARNEDKKGKMPDQDNKYEKGETVVDAKKRRRSPADKRKSDYESTMF